MWSQLGLTRTSLLMVDGHFVCLAEDGTLSLLKVHPRQYEEVARLEGPRRSERGIPAGISLLGRSHPVAWLALCPRQGPAYLPGIDSGKALAPDKRSGCY